MDQILLDHPLQRRQRAHRVRAGHPHGKLPQIEIKVEESQEDLPTTFRRKLVRIYHQLHSLIGWLFVGAVSVPDQRSP